MKRVRLYITLALLAGVVASLFLVPLPMHVMAPFELQPYNADNVYVEVPGQLVKIGVKPGQHVQKGDLIAQLENLDLEMEIARLQGERATLETEIENLDSLLYQPSKADKAAGDYDTAKKKLDGVIRELAQKEADLKRLTIVAPRAGVVIPPLRTLQRPRTDAAELPQWTGTPLDERNIGSSLSPQGQQNLICMIGDPNEWEAVMIVDQDDFGLVLDGQEVQLMFEESAYHVFKTRITSISGEHVSAAPSRLASTNGGALAAQQNPDGSMSPLNTSFQVTARLNNAQKLLHNGLTGAARIDVEPKTVMQRVWRYLARTFNFEI